MAQRASGHTPRDIGSSPAPAIAHESVIEIRHRAAFTALADDWDALVAETRDELFYRHDFIRLWLDHFAPGAPVRALLLRNGRGRLEAALPLIETRARLDPLPLPARRLGAAANVHSCRFDLLARDPARAARALLEHLIRDPGWDVLHLADIPPGGAAFALLDAARRMGLPSAERETVRSPYLPLPTDEAALFARLNGKFKANLRRRRRRLSELGSVSLERVSGGEIMPALDEGMRLEARGWKGAEGSAMAQDPATRGYYTALAHAAARRGRLALYTLRLDGRAIAFQFGLEHDGRYLLLKPAYDESLGACSPGQLLMEDTLRDGIARGLREFDFLGADMPWKRDWTDLARPHAELFIFNRGPRGRLLREARFRWGPAAKARLRRWRLS